MTASLHVLILEDNINDAELMVTELRHAGFDCQWKVVDNESDYSAGLDAKPDVILCDFRLPDFDALRALELLHRGGLDIPFILVSGTVGEELAVSIMREGASDYVMKDRMARLGQAVTQAMERRQLRLEQKLAEEAHRRSEERFRATFEQAAVGMAIVSLGGA